MKLNWKKKIASALLAAGIFVPSAAQALDIPLGDPSFEAFSVPGAGYAYANAYNVGSAWVSNPDGSGPANGGANASNWLYDADYAEDGPPFRGAPRTGVQAMHGRGFYNGQESTAVFEAGKTYTFSIYAQGDNDAELSGGQWQSRVWLYIYDGSIPFSEPNSLTFARYSPTDVVNTGPDDFVNRDTNWTQAQSQAGWQQISLSWTVQPGASEIGNPVGVAFWMTNDGAVDDASLSVVPEPSTVILVGAAGLALLGGCRRK
jgi:hypothetical protein